MDKDDGKLAQHCTTASVTVSLAGGAPAPMSDEPHGSISPAHSSTPPEAPIRPAVVDTVAEYAVRIAQRWQKSVHSILETASICAEAKRRLPGYQLRALKAQLPFKGPMFSKLCAIGSDDRLHALADKLPPSWTIISDLQRLSKADLERAVKADVVKPGLQRDKLKQWVIANEIGTAKPPRLVMPQLPKNFYAGIRVPRDYPEQRLKEFDGKLNALCADFQVQIVRQRDEVAMRALNYMKSEVARLVMFERRARRSLASKHLKPASWPFSWDETSVKEARCPDDLRFMCKQIGLETDFDLIFLTARERVDRRVQRAAENAEFRSIPDTFDEAAWREAQAPKYLQWKRKVIDFEWGGPSADEERARVAREDAEQVRAILDAVGLEDKVVDPPLDDAKTVVGHGVQTCAQEHQADERGLAVQKGSDQEADG